MSPSPLQLILNLLSNEGDETVYILNHKAAGDLLEIIYGMKVLFLICSIPFRSLFMFRIICRKCGKTKFNLKIT